MWLSGGAVLGQAQGALSSVLPRSGIDDPPGITPPARVKLASTPLPPCRRRPGMDIAARPDDVGGHDPWGEPFAPVSDHHGERLDADPVCSQVDSIEACGLLGLAALDL